MLINANQIRAARALIDWTLAHLAQEVGVGTTTISAIETGRSAGSLELLTKIIDAFQASGVEFTEDGGVRPRQSAVKTYKGHDGFADFRRDVLKAVQSGALDICVSNVDEREFSKWGGELVNRTYREEMAKIKGVNFRILVEEGDRFFSASSYAHYKWTPKREFDNIPFYVFGDTVAIISFEENNIDIFSINHPLLADFYRKQFEQNWSRALMPTGDQSS
ncbi:MAG: helix-turn-helix transcriptional regulator [Rhodospirillales bacterium]|nr:helix-turn-helix transcriptional regulator [Rhodospirillales bacterium]